MIGIAWTMWHGFELRSDAQEGRATAPREPRLCVGALRMHHWPMHYAELLPPPALGGIVRCAWELRGPAPREHTAAADPALPDGSPELIVNLGDPFEHVPVRGPVRRQPRTFLVGQITRPFAVRPTGRIDLLAIRFEAHGASLLHPNLGDIRDNWRALTARSIGLSGLLGAMSDPRRDRRLSRMWDALEALRASRGDPDPRVARAVRAIRDSGGTVNLEELATDVGVTLRTLQRLFGPSVGISPKLLAQVIRFQRVFAAARHRPRALARVAAQCGYYDQAHLVRDFRRFGGNAPTRLLTSLPQFTAFFTG